MLWRRLQDEDVGGARKNPAHRSPLDPYAVNDAQRKAGSSMVHQTKPAPETGQNWWR
eukprot:SAG22_NODE_1121_length_5508_cov_6.904234_7_plen_57_part_00